MADKPPPEHARDSSYALPLVVERGKEGSTLERAPESL